MTLSTVVSDRLRGLMASYGSEPERRTVGLMSLCEEARSLVDDPGSNPEYERALVELLTVFLGMSWDYKDQVADVLGIWPASAR